MNREAADLIVGTDGAFSAVRLAMMKTDRFGYSQSYLQHGYKELHIPAKAPGVHAVQQHALHIWPRGGAMMIALPNTDGSFTCTLFWPFEGEHGLHALRTPEEIRAHFERHYTDAVPLMPTLVEDYQRNPASSLVTVRCEPWRRGRVCLLGDAAHAIVPFYGQGMNAAFEDCVVLARELRTHADDVPAALAAYERSRKPSADAIADMALENFVEMRDLAGRADFQYTKKIEQTLHKHFGDRLAPQYNLVSFSTVPYELAQRRGREMAGLLGTVAASVPAPPAFDDAWKQRIVATATPLVRTITPIPAGSELKIP
jgi:kynurenine 3-monooxygenase